MHACMSKLIYIDHHIDISCFLDHKSLLSTRHNAYAQQFVPVTAFMSRRRQMGKGPRPLGKSK